MEHEERVELFNKHIRLAHSVAVKHWSYPLIDKDDIHQEALMSLWDATSRYDPSYGAFSTFATKSVHSRLNSYYYVHVYGRIGASSNFQKAISVVKDGTATRSKAVQAYASLIRNGADGFVSMETPISNEEGTKRTVGDSIADPVKMEDATLSKIYDSELLDEIRKEFADNSSRYKVKFPEQRAKLIEYFLAIMLGEKISRVQIANELNMSRNAISLQFIRWRKQLSKILQAKTNYV